MSWGVATLGAPTFLTIGLLLARDARSDHPFFWPSLLGIVALSNAVAILRVNQSHRRAAFARRSVLALCYLRAGMAAGCAMFVVLGWSTGALQEMVATLAEMLDASAPAIAIVMGTWSLALALALAFGLASFAHAGALHAWIAFRRGAPGPRPGA
ncbi:hypothetical protein [Cupriavidus sp. USMAA2-4]|uniref:hypothetical protein n=1 Tax=Cupriavidus sp. USMAA2-4 TaxID=876364 RepID=UPI0012F4C693|nr:hypothetical protein [Cupriavidus sp. USMAA2-4]